MSQSNDPSTTAEQAPQLPIVACALVLFSLVVVLPMLFSVGGSYFSFADMDLPTVTQWFMAMSPWIFIGMAVCATTILWTITFRGPPHLSRILSWSFIVLTALLMLAGALAFLLPVISRMGGLR